MPGGDTLSGMATTETQPPEWISPKEAVRIFGLGRTTLHTLATKGKIKTSLIRARGTQKGVRLYSYDSIRALIEEAAKPAPESQTPA